MTEIFIGMVPPYHISDWYGCCHTASSATDYRFMSEYHSSGARLSHKMHFK